MKRCLYAITFLTFAFASILAIQAVYAKTTDQLGGGDQKSRTSCRQDADAKIATINIGQEEFKLTEEQRWLKKNFPEVYWEKGQIVVFSATWCGPCQRYKPTVKRLTRKYNVLTYDIDHDRGAKLFKHYKGTGVPLTLIIVDGKVEQRWSGSQTIKTIKEKAKDCLQEGKNEKTDDFNLGPVHVDGNGNIEINIRGRNHKRSEIPQEF